MKTYKEDHKVELFTEKVLVAAKRMVQVSNDKMLYFFHIYSNELFKCEFSLLKVTPVDVALIVPF